MKTGAATVKRKKQTMKQRDKQKTVQRFLKKLKIELPYDPLLDIYY